MNSPPTKNLNIHQVSNTSYEDEFLQNESFIMSKSTTGINPKKKYEELYYLSENAVHARSLLVILMILMALAMLVNFQKVEFLQVSKIPSLSYHLKFIFLIYPPQIIICLFGGSLYILQFPSPSKPNLALIIALQFLSIILDILWIIFDTVRYISSFPP